MKKLDLDNSKFIKNIDICNISLIEILAGADGQHEYWWARDYYERGDFVWVCGTYGHEGILRDGQVLFHSKNLTEVLEFIQNYKEEN